MPTRTMKKNSCIFN